MNKKFNLKNVAYNTEGQLCQTNDRDRTYLHTQQHGKHINHMSNVQTNV